MNNPTPEQAAATASVTAKCTFLSCGTGSIPKDTINLPLQTHRKNPLGLRVIGIMKLVSACLLFAVAFGIFHLLGSDTGIALEQFVRRLHLDPDNRLITKGLAAISGISHKELKAIDAGTFLYALLYVVEGVGLILGKHWAEYLTIIATASLVPLEIFEIARKVNVMRISVLVINLAIVVYLVYRLRADRRARNADINAMHVV